MRISNFFECFDKKKFMFVLRLIILFLIVVLEINLASITYSKYESRAAGSVKPDVALFIIDAKSYSGNISLNGLLPNDNNYSYLIYLTNMNEDGEITNVNMSYQLEFLTTTNLPLSYDVIDVDTGLSVISDVVSYTDPNGVYYNVYKDEHEYHFNYGEEEKKYFRVEVSFPAMYTNNPEYQSMIDLFTVNVNAKQIVDENTD